METAHCVAAKRSLRKRILAARDRLSPEEIARASERIAAQVSALDAFVRARTLHLFVSFGSEVDTRPLLERAWRARVRTVAPRVAPDGRLEHCLIVGWEDLAPGFRGIPEPRPSCPQVPPAEVDLVLVPGVAFDAAGRRLGYGGGYYDRFLAACPGARVALAFSCQIVPEVPCEPHDLRVQAVVTEAGLLRADSRISD